MAKIALALAAFAATLLACTTSPAPPVPTLPDAGTDAAVDARHLVGADYPVTLDGAVVGPPNANTAFGLPTLPNAPNSGTTVLTDTTGTLSWSTPVPAVGCLTLEAYGAAGDGVTDDTTAYLAALRGGSPCITLGAKTYLLASLNTTTNLPTTSAKFTIQGQGDVSILKNTSNAPTINVGGQYVTVSNLQLLGSGTGVNQFGILDGSGIIGPEQGYETLLAQNVLFENFGEAAAFTYNYAGTVSLTEGAMFANCRVISVPAFGLWLFGGYENVVNVQVTASSAGTGEGIRIQTGNIVVMGGSITQVATGIHIIGGGNDGHGVVAGMELNHNTTNILVDDVVANGETFVGDNVYGTGTAVTINGNTGLVRFIGDTFDVDTYNFTNSLVQFEACLFPQNAGTNTIVNTGTPQTTWTFDNTQLNGQFPTFLLNAGINWSISQPPTTAATGTPFWIYPQQSTNANAQGGDLDVLLETPSGSGGIALGRFFTGSVASSSPIVQFGSYATTYGAVWLGNVNPRIGTVPTLFSDGVSATEISFPFLGNLYVQSTGTIYQVTNETGFQIWGGTASFGGGSGVVGEANASIIPTSNPSGGGVFYENNGSLTHRGPLGAITTMASAGSTTAVNSQTQTLVQSWGTTETISSATPALIESILTVTGSGGLFEIELVSRATSAGCGASGDTATAHYSLAYKNVGGTVTLSTAGITLVGIIQTTNALMTSTLTAAASSSSVQLSVTNPAGCTVDSQVTVTQIQN